MGSAIVSLAYLGVFFWGLNSWEWFWGAIIFHFTGGIYAFFLVREIFRFTAKYHKTQTSFLMEIMIFILGALAIGVFWEWYELAIDRYNVLIKHRQSTMPYADNIGDLVMDFLGASVASLYLMYKKRRRPPL